MKWATVTVLSTPFYLSIWHTSLSLWHTSLSILHTSMRLAFPWYYVSRLLLQLFTYQVLRMWRKIKDWCWDVTPPATPTPRTTWTGSWMGTRWSPVTPRGSPSPKAWPTGVRPSGVNSLLRMRECSMLGHIFVVRPINWWRILKWTY